VIAYFFGRSAGAGHTGGRAEAGHPSDAFSEMGERLMEAET
jgi:hypothetical protein